MKKVAIASLTFGALVWLTAPATANETQAQATVITTTTSTTASPSVAPVSLPAGFKFHKETEGLNQELRLRVELLLADPDNGGKVGLESAYRTPQRQQELVNCHAVHNPACPWPVDPPEESEHVKGNAVDFNGDLKLAVTLAKKYGLYQRYGDRDPVHFELDPNRAPMEKG